MTTLCQRRLRKMTTTLYQKLFKKRIKNKKKNIAKPKKENEQKSGPRNNKFKRIILIILLIIILVLGTWLGISTHIWKTLAKDMTLHENSVVKDTDGNVAEEHLKEYIGKKYEIIKEGQLNSFIKERA